MQKIINGNQTNLSHRKGWGKLIKNKYITATAHCQEFFQAAAFLLALLSPPATFCSFVACRNTSLPRGPWKVMVFPLPGNVPLDPQPTGNSRLGLSACRPPFLFLSLPADPILHTTKLSPLWVHGVPCGRGAFLPDARPWISCGWANQTLYMSQNLCMFASSYLWIRCGW